MKMCIVLGTRPEIVKLAPLYHVAKRRKDIEVFVIYSGQHYSENLKTAFLNDFDMPRPEYDIFVSAGTHGEQTAKMLSEIEKILLRENPDVVVVEGDTNTTLAGALAASKINGMQVAHVEAGLRSYNWSMPEEVNRVIIDHISDFLFCPTEMQKDKLKAEGIPDSKIFVVGNTISDSLKFIKHKVKRFTRIVTDKGKYRIATFHRPQNVDDKEELRKILTELARIGNVMLVTHPRTLRNIKEFKLKVPKGVEIADAMPYITFIAYLKGAKCVITDSGGVQEEACLLGVPCVTVRPDTERQETVLVGSNILSDIKSLSGKVKIMEKKAIKPQDIYGNGVSETILSILTDSIKRGKYENNGKGV